MASKGPLSDISKRIKKRGTEGATTRAAKAAGMSTREWAEKHKHDSDPKTRGRATSALAFMHAKH